ncbi:unnamed protein product [Adineta ricciae]|uniref:Vertnin n=1 Tax=Adineta ricciae TaxID=249248 RepID=A0A815WWK6_ADIRI|nr:unnamed protein product [Adineta ricciae]CAF1548681.1 unnamed protein product [Adineta ricciae]
MSRAAKFGRLLLYLEKCSESVFGLDAIYFAVDRIKKMELIKLPLEFYPNNMFDDKIDVVDSVARQYLEKASMDVRHLLPADVPGDGNCLYHSVLLLMNNSVMTTSELRVRTIVELITNEAYYSNMLASVVRPFDIAIKDVCRNNTYSELYEIVALCTVVGCNIRSVYPEIDFRADMVIMNNVFTPIPPITTNYEIKILWSSMWSEMNIRAVNNNHWSPNHFVPLMSPGIRYESDSTSRIKLINNTPEKKTTKNNIDTHVRIPEFQSSPSRRLRSETDTTNGHVQVIDVDTTGQNEREREDQHQMRLATLRDRAHRLRKDRARAESRRARETQEARQNRLEQMKGHARTSRMNESEDDRRDRLEQMKGHARNGRMDESEEGYQIRIDHQRKRSQVNRINKKLEKQAINNTILHQRDINDQVYEKRDYIHRADSPINDIILNDNATNRNKRQDFSTWPAPISAQLKEECLKQFLQRMSMGELAEVTCAICNVGSSKQQCKIVPISTISHKDLLKVSDELRDLITNIQLSIPKHSDGNI